MVPRLTRTTSLVAASLILATICLAAAAAASAKDAGTKPAATAPADPNSKAKPGAPPPPTGLDYEKAPWHDDPNDPSSQDPKALEILKAGIKALGGEQAILGRSTIYIKRKIINHEFPDPREGTVTIWFKRPNKFRKEIVYDQDKHIEVFDGTRAWFDNGSGPQSRGPAYTASILDGIKDLDMPANYLDADLTYFNITQEIPGKLAHVVKVRKNGYTRELMFDVTTNLLQMTGEYENPWGATDKMTKFDRYRPVDGILVPYRTEIWRSNRVSTESEILDVKFNGPIDDALFVYPSSTPAGK